MNAELTTKTKTTAKVLDSKRWLMLAAALGATLMGAIDIFIVNVAIPTIQHELHTGFAEMQLISAGYTLANAALLVLGGRLGDLYGRKRLFLIGVGAFTAFSALCGFAPDPLLLIVFRVLQGTAAAMMTPQVFSLIQDNFSSQERPVAMSAYAATLGLASVVGMVLGGGLIVANVLGMGWRSIFLINVPFGLIVLVASILFIKESREPATHTLDYGGVALLTLALVFFTFPLIMGGNTGWPLWTIICLPLSLPCVVAFWFYEQYTAKQGQEPLVSPELFKLHKFTAGNLTNLLDGSLWNGMIFLFSIYLQTGLHFTPLQSGLAMVVGSIAFILASSASTLILPRLGRRNISIAACLVTINYALVLLAAQYLEARWGVFPILIAFFVLCFSHALLYTPLMPKTVEEVTAAHVGAASGIYTTTLEISGTLGVAIIGLIYAVLTISGTGIALAFVLTMAFIALLSAGTIFLVRPLEGHKPHASNTTM
ncbi:MFS transporter [Ktedonospora formicarum]|uniref:MFS transporter n=1 Tax=Ktedonospora formicarum TaxID=2778364 RepID=A0A8J3MS61_9CHLR|nr:MFS transporter [Ktedonospora formicarum]GHO46767.1 MFS transporter [Ktedonospora formicarum]